jgi:outer membrane cobalamin receptor
MSTLLTIVLAQSAVLLPETIVVESRNEQALADASPSISKVKIGTTTAEGLGTLGGVLQSTPGIYTAPTSGEGSQTSLFIRGTNSSQSALLLDGRKLPQGFLNTYEIERYRTFGLSSAEVLRGASSVLYGANAIGGVIDLRLANPLCETSQGEYALTGGSYGRGSFAFHTVNNNGNETKPATQGTAFSFTSSHEDGWRPNSSLDASTALLKSEWQISPSLTVNLIGSADNSEARLPGAETNPKYNDFQNNQGWLISPGLTYYGDNLIPPQVALGMAHTKVLEFGPMRIGKRRLTIELNSPFDAMSSLISKVRQPKR